MNTKLKYVLALASVAMATQAVAQVTFYEQERFQGRSFTTERQINNLERFGFNDRASSVEVIGGRWEVCDDVRMRGNCVVLRPGRYASLSDLGLDEGVSSVRAINRSARVDDRRYAPAPVPVPAPAPVAAAATPQITFYESEGFAGRSFTTDQLVENFNQHGFNDRASSVVVAGARWEVCEDSRFSGRCVMLRPGSYGSLAVMGLNDRVSSVRPDGRDPRYVPQPVAAPDYRRRDSERLYEVQVTSVRAVVGTPTQRCWLEREEVVQDQRNSNVPGAIAGAIIGGILGHQVGGGTGKDIATVGGAVAGAAVGAQAGRNGSGPQTFAQNVQRCESVPSQARPQFWDVTYNFRGQEHRVQMTAPPGRTLTVNEQGEPRN